MTNIAVNGKHEAPFESISQTAFRCVRTQATLEFNVTEINFMDILLSLVLLAFIPILCKCSFFLGSMVVRKGSRRVDINGQRHRLLKIKIKCLQFDIFSLLDCSPCCIYCFYLFATRLVERKLCF